jgi:hypothetical protein|tara:strand:+ start:31 stop:231 length:201 start_codon:yes stop_codon:yes gene_type:complete
MKISDIVLNEFASMGGMSAGAVATVVKPIANDAQRIAQRPKKPKKTKWAHKKPGPKAKKESSIIKR